MAPCDAGHRSCKTEHNGKPAFDIDAEQTDSFTILHACTNHHAEGGEVQEGKHQPDDHQREAEVNQPPPRIVDAFTKPEPGPDIGRTGKRIRCRLRDRVGAIIVLDDFSQHDGQAERHQDLVRMGALVEEADQTAFHGNAHKAHDHNRHQHRQGHGPVYEKGSSFRTKPVLDIGNINLERVTEKIFLCLADRLVGCEQQRSQRHRAERTEHEQGSVGEVDHTQGTENECQPERDERVGPTLVQSI
jgi:hypothetical protein